MSHAAVAKSIGITRQALGSRVRTHTERGLPEPEALKKAAEGPVVIRDGAIKIGALEAGVNERTFACRVQEWMRTGLKRDEAIARAKKGPARPPGRPRKT